MAVRLLPSAEVLVVAHLKASADITALVGTRVGTELYAGTSSALWVSLVTGSEQVPNHLITAIIDVRSYGGTKQQADLLARTAHAVMVDMQGSYSQGVVSGVDTLTIPSWNPDDGFDPVRPRYLASYSVHLHTNPS